MCAAAYTQGTAYIHPRVQYRTYEENVAAYLLGVWARVTQRYRTCRASIPYP